MSKACNINCTKVVDSTKQRTEQLAHPIQPNTSRAGRYVDQDGRQRNKYFMLKPKYNPRKLMLLILVAHKNEVTPQCDSWGSVL
jgi:hypothetical protein